MNETFSLKENSKCEEVKIKNTKDRNEITLNVIDKEMYLFRENTFHNDQEEIK